MRTSVPTGARAKTVIERSSWMKAGWRRTDDEQAKASSRGAEEDEASSAAAASAALSAGGRSTFARGRSISAISSDGRSWDAATFKGEPATPTASEHRGVQQAPLSSVWRCTIACGAWCCRRLSGCSLESRDPRHVRGNSLLLPRITSRAGTSPRALAAAILPSSSSK
jgi:hypothetical protein